MHNDIQEKGQRFLAEVYLRTQGDPAATVSMYDIGEALRVHMLKSAPYLPHTFLLKIRIVPHRELFF